MRRRTCDNVRDAGLILAFCGGAVPNLAFCGGAVMVFCGPRRRLGVFSGFSEICTPEGQENYGFPAFFFCHLGVFLPFPDFCSLFLPITGCKTGAKGNKNEEFFRKRPICPSTARNSFGILLLEGNKNLEITKKRPVATVHKLVRLSRECSRGRAAGSRLLHANLLVVAGGTGGLWAGS